MGLVGEMLEKGYKIFCQDFKEEQARYSSFIKKQILKPCFFIKK
jgi:hypothetical protein